MKPGRRGGRQAAPAGAEDEDDRSDDDGEWAALLELPGPAWCLLLQHLGQRDVASLLRTSRLVQEQALKHLSSLTVGVGPAAPAAAAHKPLGPAARGITSVLQRGWSSHRAISPPLSFGLSCIGGDAVGRCEHGTQHGTASLRSTVRPQVSDRACLPIIDYRSLDRLPSLTCLTAGPDVRAAALAPLLGAALSAGRQLRSLSAPHLQLPYADLLFLLRAYPWESLDVALHVADWCAALCCAALHCLPSSR